ncbi:MAG: Gfo/Idh/MocA family protein, partial [Phycisphaeraceae bacterium]
MSKSTNQPIRAGIVGLGRSGWSIHAKSIEALPNQFQVAAVSDPDAERREEAKQTFGCRTHDSFESLIADKELDLVVVASPSHMHAEHSIAAMEAGHHVLCEKPFALSSEEADRVIAASQRTGRVIAPFQNRRYEAAFQQVQRVIESGKLGRIVQIRMAAHGFRRRWDWQTLKEYGGGTLNNTGPHFVDQALELFGPGEPEVFCLMDHTVSLGDADDHVKLVLHGEDHPIVEVEMTAACPFGQDPWLVMGTQGGLRGNARELEWKWINPDELPPREVDITPTPDRSYNREEYTW